MSRWVLGVYGLVGMCEQMGTRGGGGLRLSGYV